MFSVLEATKKSKRLLADHTRGYTIRRGRREKCIIASTAKIRFHFYQNARRTQVVGLSINVDVLASHSDANVLTQINTV